MSDFFTRLIARTQGSAHVAQPVIPPVFAQVSSTSGYYAENSMQVPLDGAILTSFSNYFTSRKPDQPFHKRSNNRFAQSEHIESALSDHVGSVFPDQKQNFSASNESPINKVISEIDQNDSEHSSVPQNIPEAEADQKIDTQLKHPFNEKRDAYAALIKSGHVSSTQERLQEQPEQRDLNISQQPENSVNDKQHISGELISFDRALRKITESIELQSTMTSYSEPHSSGKIRIKQNAKPEASSTEATIKVTIGRVEVRAIMPQASKTQAQRPRLQSQILSLDDYLKHRNEGKR